MIICWIHQKVIGLSDPGSIPFRSTRSHLARCPCCRELMEQYQSLAAQLTTTANREMVPSSPFLAAKIRRRLETSEGEPAASPTIPAFRWVFVASLITLLFLCLTAIKEHPSIPSLPGPRLAQPTPIQDSAEDANLFAQPRVQAFTARLGAPLRQELEFILSDARTAVEVVSYQVLPEPLLVPLNP